MQQGKYVGQLQEKWTFPSDHLPIGILLDGIRIISWNVLNSNALKWLIEKDVLGLRNSSIGRDNIPYNERISIRENNVLDILLLMLEESVILAIQECSPLFLEELRIRVSNRDLILAKDGVLDQNITIFNKSRLQLVSIENPTIFSKKPTWTLQNIVFFDRIREINFRIINTRLPGEPGNPAPKELLDYAKQYSDELLIIIGDMNITDLEMAKYMQDNQIDAKLIAPYCTNIQPYEFFSKSIDHFLLFNANQVITLDPEQVHKGLSRDLSHLQ